jgi:catechol 2,3-dioxygenase-like lactoylglutathione lyase family enzyme
LSEGSVSQRIIEAYSLPKNTTAREVVMGNSGTKRGFIRLIEFVDVDQVQIRSSAQSWDTGGIFDVNFRVLSMQKKFKEMQEYGWQSASDPVEFSFGPFVVKEWLPRGPDGIVFAMIERVQPPLEGWPHLREMSRLFNATQVVADIEEAKDFYIDKLGFKLYLEHKGASSKEGPNVLGLPHNLTTKIDREVYILHPTGVNEGSVEILSFDGAVGRDFSALAVPPNLGILMLRFPVYDIDEIYQLSIDKNIEVIFPPMKVRLDPYGEIDLMAVKGPGGVWLEFYENND